MKEPKPVSEHKSDCCFAPLKVVGGDEGTNHYECTKCEKSCDDAFYSPAPSPAEDPPVGSSAQKSPVEDYEKMFDEMVRDFTAHGFMAKSEARTRFNEIIKRVESDAFARGFDQGRLTSFSHFATAIKKDALSTFKARVVEEIESLRPQKPYPNASNGYQNDLGAEDKKAEKKLEEILKIIKEL